MSNADLNQKLSGKQTFLYLTVGIVAVIIIANVHSLFSETPRQISNPNPSLPLPATSVSSSSSSTSSSGIFSPNYKPETEKEFKASCKKVVQQDDGKNIYYKELLKNPRKFTGDRIQLPVKIMKIEESNGRTWIQGYISNSYDTAVIDFKGTMKIYEGDIVRVYGFGMGTFEGKNMMGATITVPAIEAQYIKKIGSGN